MLDDNFVKRIAWYDNERGYSNKLLDMSPYVYGGSSGMTAFVKWRTYDPLFTNPVDFCNIPYELITLCIMHALAATDVQSEWPPCGANFEVIRYSDRKSYSNLYVRCAFIFCENAGAVFCFSVSVCKSSARPKAILRQCKRISLML